MEFLKAISSSSPLIIIFMILAAFILGLVVLWMIYRKKYGDVSKNIAIMLSDAEKEAAIIKKEAEIERKDLILKTKSDLEQEINNRKQELNAMEKRFLAKEEILEKKYNTIDKKENDLSVKEKNLKDKSNEISLIKEELSKNLEQKKNQLLKIARFTEEEAKNSLFKILEEELNHERANLIRKAESEARLVAEKKARNIIVMTIQKQAIDQCQEHSTKLLPIPSDEMKGRIIGRDGRNIRAFEQACGVDLIVDDTPDAILISCFDPIRKHIAKTSLERLLADGRIHPARVEEVVNKVRKETGLAIRDVAEEVILDLAINSVHPELMKLIGQLQFRFSYGQQQLKHCIEVSQLAGVMAAELGVDVKMAKRAGLLHDIGKAVTHEIEGPHAMIGADLCRKYGESADVEHAVRAHHQDVEARTVLAYIVEAADAISGGRPGARSKTEASFIQRLESLEEICMSYKGVQRSFAVQAGRDVRVMVDPQIINDDQAVILARNITKRISDEVQFPGQIKVNVIREYRATEIAQ